MPGSAKTLEPLISASTVLVLVGLVWLVPVWPSQDGYSHLYTSVVLADLRYTPDSVFAPYFFDNLGLGTNQFFHGFVVLLAPYLSPWSAHKLFATLYIALMVFALRRYMRAVRPTSVGSAPLFYTLVLSYPFFMGFYNFVIGIPLCLLALSLIIEHVADERTRTRRLGLVFVLTGFCYVAHIACVLVLLGAAVVFTFRAKGALGKRWLGVLSIVAPVLLLILWGWLFQSDGPVSGTAPGPEIGFKAPWLNLGSLLWHMTVSFSYAEFAVGGVVLGLVVVVVVWRVIAARRGTFELTPLERSAAWASLGLFVVFMVTPYSLAQFHYVNTRAIPFLYFLAAPLIHLPKRVWPKFAAGLGVLLLVAQLLLLQGPVRQGAESLDSLREMASSECVAQLHGQDFVPLRDDAQTFSDHVRWRASMWAPLAIEAELISPAAFGYRSTFPLVFHHPDWPVPWSTQIDGDVARLVLHDEAHRSAYSTVLAFPNSEPIRRLEVVVGDEVVEQLDPICITPEVSVFNVGGAGE